MRKFVCGDQKVQSKQYSRQMVSEASFVNLQLKALSYLKVNSKQSELFQMIPNVGSNGIAR